MTNIVPGALWRPIDVGNRARRVKGRGLIGHVAVSGSTLLLPGPLSTRAADWTFYLPKEPYPTGERFAQLIDLDLQCWSSGAGNLTCPAFESQGGLGTTAQVNAEPWTGNQVESAATILAHLHVTEGTPLQDMGNSLAGSRGFGVHRYGIDPWRVAGGQVWSSSRGKLCPGDAKVRQIPAIVARAQQIVNGDDMPLTPTDVALEWYGVKFREDRNYAQVIHNIEDQAVAAATQLTGLTAAVSTLAQAYAAGRDDLTADELTAAVRQGIAEGGAAVIAAQEASRAAQPAT
jgi:hypothetical protein